MHASDLLLMNVKIEYVSFDLFCSAVQTFVECSRARALAPWVLLVLVFGGHFLEAGVVRRVLEGWVPAPLEFNTYPFPFGTFLG